MHGFIFLSFVAGIIIYVVSRRHIERMILIEQGIMPQMLIKKQPLNRNFRSLFYGVFATGSGVSLLIGSLVSGAGGFILFFGIMLVCTGAASLVYWKLTAPDRRLALEMYEKQQRILLGIRAE